MIGRMLKKAFLEITNVCNLTCPFCHGTGRQTRFISVSEFKTAAEKIRPFAEYLYFHLMGEPLLHPELERFFGIADELGFKVILTTNGTLLDKKAPILLAAPALHKVSISLHCYEVNSMGLSLDEYLSRCFDFATKAAERGKIAVLRLWNKGGFDSQNESILAEMRGFFGAEWKEVYSGYKIKDKIFLEWGELFDWPDADGEYVGSDHSCYGLRDQVGILSDGSVVPCCLDADGAITLGNIFTDDLGNILDSPRAKALRRSFQNKNVTEPLCQKCGYAGKRF